MMFNVENTVQHVGSDCDNNVSTYGEQNTRKR